jgi:hypothetical protein
MPVMPPTGADARRKFGTRKMAVSPVVSVLAVLGATYLLASPVPALLAAGVYFISRKKKGDVSAEESLEELKKSQAFEER